jgi:hypothetical protein
MKNWPFALWGGDGSENDGENNDEGESSEEEEPEVLTMTQVELDATIARAASRASRRARKDVRKDLGFESQEDLDAFVATTREAADANKDEAAQAQAELDTGRTELASAQKQVLEDGVKLTIDRSIVLAGITDEAIVKRIRTLVRSEMGTVDSETLTDDVADAIESVKTDVPSLFDVEKKSGSGSGDGGAQNTKLTEDEAKEARRKQYEAEYAGRGLVIKAQ